MYNIKTKGDKYLIKNNFKRKKEVISWNLKKSQIYPIWLKSNFFKSNFCKSQFDKNPIYSNPISQKSNFKK